MSIRYSLDGNVKEKTLRLIKWLEIVKENKFDFYFEPIGNRRQVLIVSVHAIGLNFPIAIIVNGRVLAEEDIEPSKEALDIFFTTAMSDVETISVSDDDKVIDAFYTTSIKKLKQYIT